MKVLITGSSRGLGKELALEFSRNGYSVIANGRRLSELQELYAQTECEVIQGDITEERTLNLLGQIKGLDILVNNAGIISNKPFNELTEEEIRKLMEVNFFAPIELTRRLLPSFLERKGLIVNINSVAGQLGCINKSVYCASKFALRGFFDSLKYEVTKQGVRILNVYLGAMQTDMSKDRTEYENLMKPDEVAKVIVRNCKLSDTLYIPELNIGRVKYGN